jgi:PIN domain
MLHVIIDTSIYRKDPKRTTGAFRALTRLCEGKKVTLYVPEYVKREFLSQQKIAVEDEIRNIKTGAKSISRRSLDEKLIAFADEVGGAADKILPKIGVRTTEEFTRWAKRCKAVASKIKLEHALRVTDDYFEGAAPFTSVKNRNDIPDSFIWQTVLDLADGKKRVYFVVHDGALVKSAQSLSNVTVYETLEAFIDSPECKKALEDLTTEVVARNIARAKLILSRSESSLKGTVEKDIVDALMNGTVHDSSIPDDNGEGVIMGADSPENVTFNFEGIEYYGGSEIGIPFTATVDCELNYAIYKPDYYLLDEDKTEKISISERNEHYYDADETYTLDVTGVLSVELETDKLENARTTEENIEEAILTGERKLEITEKTVAAGVSPG